MYIYIYWLIFFVIYDKNEDSGLVTQWLILIIENDQYINKLLQL